METQQATASNWKDILGEERQQQYFTDLLAFIERERAAGKTIYPKNSEIFAALTLCPFEKLKVVIIGQDPYHGANQAHGLSFSVKQGIALPPSLKNIYKEIQADLGRPQNSVAGDLTFWAEQGVLLLNSVLSVEASRPASHSSLGWERFTDKIISEINQHKTNIVFMLWGAYAQKKGALIDPSRHLILKAPHPSPFSAHSGFLGCKHFSTCNQFLNSKDISEINW